MPKGLAPALARIKADDLDIAALGARTRDAGVVAIPFVKAVEALLPDRLRAHVHKGATSQDIVDTALVLQMAQAFSLIAADLVAILDGLTALARKHARSPCVGRTYGQHAAPITFGYVAGTWGSGIAEVAAELPGLRERTLTASLGGPVGTLAGLGDAAETVGKRFAKDLGLGVAPVTWHTSRGRMVAVGAGWRRSPRPSPAWRPTSSSSRQPRSARSARHRPQAAAVPRPCRTSRTRFPPR